MYARIDLDPSAEQKVNAIRLLRRVPEFEEATGISSDTEDLRKLMFDTMVEDLDCDLSYDDDVKPWIGDRAGVAVVPVGDEPVTVVAIQVGDQQAAEDAVAAIEDCGVGGSVAMDPGMAAGAAGASAPSLGLTNANVVLDDEGDGVKVDFVGDYMLLANNPDALPDIVKEAESEPLSDNERFSSDMSALDGEGIASFWMDVKGVSDTFEEMSPGGPNPVGIEGVDSAFGAVRAGSDHIELVTQSTGDVELSADVANPITELPDSTLMAASVSGGAGLVDKYWPDLQEAIEGFAGPGAYTEVLTTVEEVSGLRLPDDLSTILGDNITLAMDGNGLTAEALQAGDPGAINVGARLTTDQAAVRELVDRVNAKLMAEGMPEGLITEETDDGLVVASNQDYAGQLAGGGDLGSSDAFETAVPDASESSAAFYLDFDKLQDALAQGDSVDAEELDQLEPMRAVGGSLVEVDDGQRMTVRLVFD